jgi:hypothetical protein
MLDYGVILGIGKNTLVYFRLHLEAFWGTGLGKQETGVGLKEASIA